jgi:hypothetical protein
LIASPKILTFIRTYGKTTDEERIINVFYEGSAEQNKYAFKQNGRDEGIDRAI